MMLVRKVGIYGVLASYMMLMFGGILLLDPSDRSEMLQRRLGIYCQHMMMTSLL